MRVGTTEKLLCREILLLRGQLQKFLLDGRNAVLRVEHLVQLTRKLRSILRQFLPFFCRQKPFAHIGVTTGLCLQKGILILGVAQERCQEAKTFLFQLFYHIVGGGVVAGNNSNGLPSAHGIGQNV